MTRVRISTTVDGMRLEQARKILGLRDCDLFDLALEAALREAKITGELAAMERFPYTADAELAMPAPPTDTADSLPYDAEVPAHVRALAHERRMRRRAGPS